MTHSAHSSAGSSSAPSLSPFPLAPFGWTILREGAFREHFPPPLEPGRIVAASRGLALVRTAEDECWCAPSGRLRKKLEAENLAPCAGDWVALQRQPGESRAVMLDLLARGPSLVRQGAGPLGRPQCLAANLDLAFLVMGMDLDFNPARLERLLALAWGSGARPVVVLTKRDLSDRPAAFVARIEGVAPGVQVLSTCALSGVGLADLRACLSEGRTAVMAGSSGAGKSTLLNALMGEEVRRTREVRASDGRGRHTTSLRELFLLPGGGCLIDTPGIREVGLCAEGADLGNAFSDISAFASRCRFRDCAHGAEPGCAVQEALAGGMLDPDRYGHYLRLRREVAFDAARSDERLWREREEKWRRISKFQKQLKKG